jgi:hypothetical protein
VSVFVTALRENPELAIFLTLALGFVIGRIRVRSFGLGNVVGCRFSVAPCPTRSATSCSPRGGRSSFS